MAGTPADGVGLATVPGNVGVNEVDNVRSDRCLHDIRERNGWGCVSGHIAFEGLNGNEGTSSGGHGCKGKGEE